MILFGEFRERYGHVVGRAFLKLRNTDVAEAVFKRFTLDGLHLDDGSCDFHHDGFRDALARDGEHDAGVGFAAHQLHVFVQRQVGRRFIVDFDDEVTRQDTRASRRCVVNRRHDAHARRILGDFDAESSEFAYGAFFKVFKRFGV